MTYLEKYHNILSDEYPEFIDKYLKSEELKRLKGIGQFCGCDYNKLYNIKFWYTRYDHVKSVALMTYHFCKKAFMSEIETKKQVIYALSHDAGTPVFSHSVDFYLDDALKQESSEKPLQDIIKSDYFLNCLKLDDLTVEDLMNYKKFTIVENKSPKLCTDRLDGILHTAYIWLNNYDLNIIEKLYKSIVVLNNNELEIGFNDIEVAENFFDLVYNYAIGLQMNEDQFTLRYFGDCLGYLIDNNVIEYEDLYKYDEEIFIKLFEKHITSWSKFQNITKLNKSNVKFKNAYERIEVKKRYVNPLCMINNELIRLDKVSNKTKQKIIEYNNFDDSKYYGL